MARDEPNRFQSILAFIDVDPDAGFEAGFVDVEDAIALVDTNYLTDDRRAAPLQFTGEGRVLDLPVTAQAWRDGLCSVVDRPFAPGEEQLLPPGISTEPACRGHR